jgi:phosphate butyryltransferase
MMFTRLQELVSEAQKGGPKRVAVVAAENDLVLNSVKKAQDQGLIEPLLVGDQDQIRALVSGMGYEIGNTRIVHTPTHEDAAPLAVELVRQGEADILMKGYLHTSDFLHAVLNKQSGLRTARLLSHVFVMQIPMYHKLLGITDAAINIHPTLLQKAAIIQNAVDMFRQLDVERPKVAALSAVETVNPDIPSTIDAACLHKMSDRNQIKNAIVDGPLAFDNAISAEAAHEKGIDSQVSGDGDIFLAPDLDAGNILYKNLQYLANAQVAGIVMGARVPIVLTSRSDPPMARVFSLALANLICANQNMFDRSCS